MVDKITLLQEEMTEITTTSQEQKQSEISSSTVLIAAAAAAHAAYTVGKVADTASGPKVSFGGSKANSTGSNGAADAASGPKGALGGSRVDPTGSNGYAPTAATSDPGSWPNVNWPIDPLDDPGFDFDLNVTGRPVIDAFGGDGILQELYTMFNDLKNFNSDGTIMPQMIQFIGNIAADPTVANNPQIQAFFNTPVSSSGETIGTFLINQVVFQQWGNTLATGGTLAQANAAATALAEQLSAQFSSMGVSGSNPIAGDMVNEINALLGSGNGSISTFAASFYDPTTNRPYYTNSQGQKVYFDEPSDIVPFGGGIMEFNQFIDGNLSLWVGGGSYWGVIDPKTGQMGTVTAPSSNLGTRLKSLFSLEFDAEMGNQKNPMILIVLLMVLLGMGKDGDYQTQLGGLGSTTKWLTQETSEVSTDIANFTPGTFGTPGSSGVVYNGQAAMQWMNSIQNLFNEADNNQGNLDPNFLSTIKSLVSGIYNTQLPADMTGGTKFPPGTTLGDLVQQNDQQGLAQALYELSGGAGPTVTTPILDNLNTASKAYTDRSQTVQTSTSADANADNQITSMLNTALNDTSVGIIAAENASVKVQISS